MGAPSRSVSVSSRLGAPREVLPGGVTWRARLGVGVALLDEPSFAPETRSTAWARARSPFPRESLLGPPAQPVTCAQASPSGPKDRLGRLRRTVLRKQESKAFRALDDLPHTALTLEGGREPSGLRPDEGRSPRRGPRSCTSTPPSSSSRVSPSAARIGHFGKLGAPGATEPARDSTDFPDR